MNDLSFNVHEVVKKETRVGTCWCDKEKGVRRLNCMPKYHVIGVHKAGTKALLKYLDKNPALLGPYKEDPVVW